MIAVLSVGFPRTYRRIIEGIRATNISREQERNIRNAIKMSFRFPITAPKQLLQSDVASFIVKNGVTILSNKNMPGFFQTIADVVSQPISSGSSFVDLVKRYHSESKTKK